jgi:hypothetical protein
MTAFSELVIASFSAVLGLMKPKPYEMINMPTITPAAPVHSEGVTTSQSIFMSIPLVDQKNMVRVQTERSLSKIAHSVEEKEACYAMRPTQRQYG